MDPDFSELSAVPVSSGPAADVAALPNDSNQRRAAVMIVTRNRPKMLSDLLASLQALAPPDNCEVVFIIVDNSPAGSAAGTFKNFEAIVCSRRARYVLEPKTGIPFARNRALDEAVAFGADLGAFVDDDEVVDSAWLAELVMASQMRNLDLVGGPVRPIPWGDYALTNWQKRILDGVQWRYRRKERHSARRARRGKDDEIVVLTNSWLIDLNWWRKSTLRFDEALQYSGGSDALFFNQAKRRGVRSGWCASAIVYEATTTGRLSFRYQFTRARNQAIANFRRRHERRSPMIVATTVGSCIVKIMVALGSLGAVPFLGGPAIVQAARSSGWTLGRLQALAGAQSEHYRVVDGA